MSLLAVFWFGTVCYGEHAIEHFGIGIPYFSGTLWTVHTHILMPPLACVRSLAGQSHVTTTRIRIVYILTNIDAGRTSTSPARGTI